MLSERPILILAASAGAGHLTAARALEHAILSRQPEARVVVHDVLQTTSPFFRTLYAKGYVELVNHAPTAMGWLYDATDRPERYLRSGLRSMFQNVNAYPTMRWLIRAQPRLIINTHFLPAEIVAGMRRSRRLRCPQVTVTTDFETHRLWVQPPTERYYTASEEGGHYLGAWGVPHTSVVVTGIPVRREFEQPLDAADVRRRYGFAADQPLVLLLSGGFGVGRTEALLDGLLTTAQHVQILAVAGRNRALQSRLERRALDLPRGRLWVLGYTRRMHEWMQAADLVVTKPGGLTAAEALHCGLPLVVVNPIPGQETRNSDYLLERGAAIKVNNPRLLGFRVQKLLDEPRRLALLRQCALRLARPGAADRIAQDALSLL
ncbi:MAG: glycosyltransferase [Phycisphaerae bacterium]|jgi:processive 1,2-diacylglycerol beta-glucosyltransferase